MATLQHGAWVSQVVFSPDGSHLVTASRDGTARLWRIIMNDLVELACQIVSCDLTDEEWGTYFGDAEPYRATCPG